MGRSPTPPTIIMPSESNPQAFQTIIPQKSYKDLAESMRRTEKEYNRLLDSRYDTVGTPAEMGAKARAVEMQAAASYASSLPKGTADERFKETPRDFPIKSNNRATFDTVPGSMAGYGSARPGTGSGGSKKGFQSGVPRKMGRRGFFPMPPKDPAKEAASMNYRRAKDDYFEAVKRAKTKPRSFMPITKDPGFAQNPDSMYVPEVINAPDKKD